ncbi:MAG: hypothetical protein AMXMBFR53_29970 [Gemmatimonadota bacterium]
MSRFGMNPGMLREVVELQRVTRVSDGQGGWTEAWTTYATVWARVAPMRATERLTGMQPDARAYYSVTIRAHRGLRAPDRLLWGVQILDVLGPPVNRDERHGYMSLETSYDADLTFGSYLPGMDELMGTRAGSAAILELA